LYVNSWATAARITEAISLYTTQRLALPKGYAWELYKKHGTALKGLLAEGHLTEESVEEYLHAVHDVPLDDIAPDPALRAMLERILVRRFVFTASSREHAGRCIARVGVEGVFEGVIDCRDCDLATKHDPESFKRAMAKAGVADATRCMLIDDSVANIRTAKALGMKTVLVGLYERNTGARVQCPEADWHIARLLDFSDALPQLLAPPRL